MSHELVEQKTGELVSVLDRQGIGELLRPLIREIHLFDSFVSGTAQLKEPAVLAEIRPDDRLKLVREDSKFDSNAVMILTEDGKKLGYVPEKDNVIFARLMDAGKLLGARVTGISQKGSYTQIAIGIYLVDF